MIWHVLACVAMALMVLSCIVQLTAWMQEGTHSSPTQESVDVATIGKTRFLARTLLVLALLLQSAITMHVAVGTPW